MVLETKVSYHDNHLAELNQVIYQQQQKLDLLEAQVRRMIVQLKQLGFEGDPEPNQKPPHY